MNSYILFAILTIFSSAVYSCQTKILRMVYQSSSSDHPTEVGQPQIYRLQKQAINADFSVNKLKNLDDHRKDKASLMQIFDPVNGYFNYYQFISTFKGRALVFPGDDLKDSVKIFHDILIVKTNRQNKILDAFQYTLEWAERPCQYDLFRSSHNDISLTDNMDITMLNFVRTEYWNANDKLLKDKGTIKLK